MESRVSQIRASGVRGMANGTGTSDRGRKEKSLVHFAPRLFRHPGRLDRNACSFHVFVLQRKVRLRLAAQRCGHRKPVQRGQLENSSPRHAFLLRRQHGCGEFFSMYGKAFRNRSVDFIRTPLRAVSQNFLRHKPWRVALSVPWANQIEITLITCTTLMLASAYSRKPGIELDFTYAGHVASFFISLVFTPIRAVLCAWILRTYFGPDPAVDGAFGTEIVQWLDLAPICLMVPFFVSVVRVRPCLVNLIRTNPIRSILFAGILFLSAFPPVVISLCMARYATSATILGFYISWPLISVCAPLAGVAGVTSCLVVTGFSTLIYIPFADYSQLALKISVVQYRQDQVRC